MTIPAVHTVDAITGNSDIDVPVLIVGGGGAGLTASMLLSQLGVDTLLVSARPQTSTLPKAHILNQRTMEILRDVGVADTVYGLATPPEQMTHVAWYAGLRGEHDDYGRQLGKLEIWGAGGANPAWAAASACRPTNLPQIRLECVLKRRADELAPGRIRFGHVVTAIEQDDDGVTATVSNTELGTSYQVRSRYLLGCDGGRMVGPSLGVTMDGVSDLFNSVSVHITADLSRWARDPEVLIRLVWLPHIGTSCVLVPMGPERWGPDSEEWVFHLTFPMDDPRVLDDDTVIAEMRAALGLSNHDIQVNGITHWSVEGVVAERFRDKSVFLLGDAARRLPPTGGLGLNSAVQDAHNLAWKLAAVLNGNAESPLLDTYEDERKPVAVHNVQHAVNNIMHHLQSMEAAGFGPGTEPEANWASLRRLWSGRDEDAEFRATMRRTFAGQSMEFDALNVEYGYTYDSAAVVGDGTPEPVNPDPIRVYQPGTRPGQPLPHAWLDDAVTRIPIMDLVRPGCFLLLTGEDDDTWADAAAKVAVDLAVPLDSVRIGHVDGDYLASRSTWIAHRGIGPRGAVLVRPDRFVAWRSTDGAQDPVAEITLALNQILGR